MDRFLAGLSYPLNLLIGVDAIEVDHGGRLSAMSGLRPLVIVESDPALDAGLDTTMPDGRLIFHVFASIAQFERERISERTREGLDAARRRGRVGGRPPALSAAQKDEVRRMREEEGRSLPDEARYL